MNPQDLMKPRYKVIADYPFSKDRIGDVLELVIDRNDVWDNCRTGKRQAVIPPAYPAIFKPLQWWEERKAEDMPEYVKDATGKVWRVKSWTSGTIQIESGNAWRIVPNVMCFYEPITESEYLQSKEAIKQLK